MDLNETICFCADVTAGDIKKAYDEGHTTVDAIGEATEAGTHCGGCQGQSTCCSIKAFDRYGNIK